MLEIIQKLEDIGLNEKSAKLYLAALELGPSPIAKLAKKSGLKRTTIYHFIDLLINKGLLISSVSGKRKLFSAMNPNNFENVIDKQKELAKHILPELSALYHKTSVQPKISLYEGDDGLKKVFMDSLNQENSSEILYTAPYWGDIYKVFPKSFIESYSNKRIAKNIHTRAIVPNEKQNSEMLKENARKKRKVIMIPKDKLNISIETRIYGNKVSIMSLGNEKIGIIIESTQIAESQREIFNLLWEKLK